MELRNRATGAITTDSQLRAEFPNTSFPKVLTPEIIDDLGYDPILESPQAVITPPYQYSQRAGIEEVNGQWFTKYVAGPIFTDYEDEDGNIIPAAQQEAAYRVQKDEEQAKAVCADRNKRLADCDWTQLSDAPVSAAPWASYRQALRDISDQSGFPWEIEWPEEPA